MPDDEADDLYPDEPNSGSDPDAGATGDDPNIVNISLGDLLTSISHLFGSQRELTATEAKNARLDAMEIAFAKWDPHYARAVGYLSRIVRGNLQPEGFETRIAPFLLFRTIEFFQCFLNSEEQGKVRNHLEAALRVATQIAQERSTNQEEPPNYEKDLADVERLDDAMQVCKRAITKYRETSKPTVLPQPPPDIRLN